MASPYCALTGARPFVTLWACTSSVWRKAACLEDEARCPRLSDVVAGLGCADASEGDCRPLVADTWLDTVATGREALLCCGMSL